MCESWEWGHGQSGVSFVRTTLFVDGLAPCKPIDGSDDLVGMFRIHAFSKPKRETSGVRPPRAAVLVACQVDGPDDRMPLRGRTVPPSTA